MCGVGAKSAVRRPSLGEGSVQGFGECRAVAQLGPGREKDVHW
jgi:hypothetical protein